MIETRKRRKEDGVEMAIETGKLLLAVVAAASDVLPPLKAVANGLDFIVKHIDTIGDIRTSMNNLSERICKIQSMLLSESYAEHESRGHDELQRELNNINKTLETMEKKNRSIFTRVIQAKNDAARMQEYVNSIERALFNYQLSITQDIYNMNLTQLEHDELNTLTGLARAPDAGFDGFDDRSRCLTGTRIAILRDLAAWAADPSARQLFWLYGLAGSGKSTIAQSFAELLVADRKLGASFFCSRNLAQRGDMRMIFPTLAFQLARADNPNSLQFRAALLHALRTRPDIASASMALQLEHLLISPVRESGITTVVLLEALDECKDERATSVVLELLSSNIHSMPTVKFFITSRPDANIRSGFRLPGLKPITTVMVLHEVDALSVRQDIRLFLQKRLTSIAASRSDVDLSEEWPKDDDIDALADKSSGLFIFASTIVKYIESGDHDPQARLRDLLDKRAGSQGEGLSGLDELYRSILRSACAKLDEDSSQRLRSILGLLVVARDSLPGPAIADMLNITWFNVKTALRPLHSLLASADSRDIPIRFCHKSFPDFLVDPARCTDTRIAVDESLHHFNATQRCFEIMKGNLKKNICRMPRYSENISLERSIVDQNVSKALRYSCRYWADHMLLSGSSHQDRLRVIRPLLHVFLTIHQLHWFEVLGLLQELWRAHLSLKDTIAWLKSDLDHRPISLDWAIDGHMFLLYAFNIINKSVAHIYHSALPMAPETSLLKPGPAVSCSVASFSPVAHRWRSI